MPEIEYAYAAARDLVLVGGSDPPPRCPDLLTGGALGIEQLVIGHDEMRAVAYIEPSRHVHAVGDQLLDLVEQRIRIEHDTVADRAAHARVKDAAWNLMQHERATADRNRMSGIRTPLVSDHPVGALGDDVDELAFA